MNRSAFLLLIAPALSLADNPLECVESDFVGAFLSGSDSAPISYSTEIPEHFEVREFPSGMKLVGSRNSRHATTVIFQTDKAGRDAYSELADTLSKQGWEDVTEEQSPSGRGFQLTGRSLVAAYCRDNDDTHLTVIVSERLEHTLVSLEQYDRKTLRGCLRTARERRRNLLDRLPVLDPPDGAATSNLIIGKNGHAVSTGIDISDSMSRGELHDFFDDQIGSEGWAFVTKWSSELSTGSVWSQNTSEQGILIATLHLYDAGSEPIRVQFSIDTADPARDIEHGMSTHSFGECN